MRIGRRLSLRIWLMGALVGSFGMAVPADAQEKPTTTTALPRIRQAVTALAASPTVATGTVGYYLARLDQPDRPLVQRNPRQSFIPASTLKTITTGAALELLGPEFVFETRVTWHPATGDVHIRGGGDPSLGRGGWEEVFDGWLGGLRARGITEVRGRIVADESAWESQELPGGWTWLDIGNYYAPPLTPLAFHDNECQLWFRLAGSPGDRAEFYDADPWPDGLRIIDEVLIGEPGTGDQAYASGSPGESRYVLRGTFAQDAGREFIRVALPDPALFCVQQFHRFLQHRGVPVHGAPTTSRRLAAQGRSLEADEGEVVAAHRSAPLRELLVPINHQSLNLDCENLLRTLGEGEAAAGLARIREHLKARGLPLAGFEQTDGSGLSRTNMITPEALARANAAVLNGPHGGAFLASLPVLGDSRSTLRQLKPSARGSVIHAKSGTIERVKAYVGLIEGRANRRYIFAVMVNNFDGPYSRDAGPRLAALFDAMSGL